MRQSHAISMRIPKLKRLGYAVYEKGFADTKADWFDPAVEEKTENNILSITIENGNIYEVDLSKTKSILEHEMKYGISSGCSHRPFSRNGEQG
jgi:hypothetical protein